MSDPWGPRNFGIAFVGVIVAILAWRLPVAAPLREAIDGGISGDSSSGPTTSQVVVDPPPPGRAISSRPPLQTGPDNSQAHAYCDGGFVNGDVNAGRGSYVTSCRFTENVLNAYVSAYGSLSFDERGLTVPGAVDCRTVPGAECSGSDFVVHCRPSGSWVDCTAGRDAHIYLW